MLLAICTTQVKESSKKEILKKKKNKVVKNLLHGDSNKHSDNQLELKGNSFTHWTNSVHGDKRNLKEVYIPSLWWLKIMSFQWFYW